jgi:uncharacterized membrane protein YphA (DoxX/SURF4 family)
MSVLFKAHGTPSIGLLFIRVTAGIYSLSLGIMQANNIEAYISRVKALQFFSENTAFIIGFITPFILIIFGGLYLMGFFTPASSLVLALITLIKIISKGLFPAEEIPFNKDFIFLACFLTTLFAGSGIFSFDALLDRKKKKVTDVKTITQTPEVISEKPVTANEEEKIP